MALIRLDDNVVAGAYGGLAYAEGWSLERLLEAATAIVRRDDAVTAAISGNGIGLHGSFRASRRLRADNDARTVADFAGHGPGPALEDLSPETHRLLQALAAASGLREEPEVQVDPGRSRDGPRVAISWNPLQGEAAADAAFRAAALRRRDDAIADALRAPVDGAGTATETIG